MPTNEELTALVGMLAEALQHAIDFIEGWANELPNATEEILPVLEAVLATAPEQAAAELRALRGSLCAANRDNARLAAETLELGARVAEQDKEMQDAEARLIAACKRAGVAYSVEGSAAALGERVAKLEALPETLRAREALAFANFTLLLRMQGGPDGNDKR